MKRSLKTLRENKQILIIGAYGLESRDAKWKAKGLGEATGREFTLVEENPGKWRLNGTDSSGSRKRVRFLARDLGEAVEQAEQILFGGIVRAGHPQLRLSDAFFQSIENSGGSEEHKADYTRFASYFCSWAESRGIQYWHDLRYEHVRGYMLDSIKRGLASKSVSRYLEPVRQASRFAAANWPEAYRDICHSLRLPANIGCNGTYDENEGIPTLTFEAALAFFDWLEDYPQREILQPAVLLMATAGFQLREALRLQSREIDWKEGTAVIQAHPELGEVVKNRYRIRKIPMPQIVLDYLMAKGGTHSNVVPYAGDDDGLAKILKRALLVWDPNCPIAPKDFRKTLSTHALEHTSDEGWNIHLVDRYIGHSPRSVLERHYFGDRKGRLVDVLRDVSSRIDDVIERINRTRKACGGTKVQALGAQARPEEAKRHKMARPLSIVPFLKRGSDEEVA